ncbi:MAG: HPF/RaiA family ribosome-associated protein [Pirellulales bacterium]
MNVKIVDRNATLSGDLEQLAERRVQFALSRFEAKTQSVLLVLEDVNGPRGGSDKSCRVVVRMKAGDTVVIRHQGADVASCLTRAIDRASRTLARNLARQRTTRLKVSTGQPTQD